MMGDCTVCDAASNFLRRVGDERPCVIAPSATRQATQRVGLGMEGPFGEKRETCASLPSRYLRALWGGVGEGLRGRGGGEGEGSRGKMGVAWGRGRPRGMACGKPLWLWAWGEEPRWVVGA